jgi:hypothetical protein
MEKGLERYVIYSFNEPITIRTQIVNRVFYKDLLVEVTIPCKVPFGFLFGTTDSEGNLLFMKRYPFTTGNRGISLANRFG